MAKRVIAVRAGGPEVLCLETYEPAAPGAGEVRVRNQACGVAFADVLLREGLYPGHKPPVVPGYEVVGRIAALGPDVASVKVGDYVAALTVIGGYASEVIVPAADLVPVPEALSPETAAALVLNGLTAYQMLERAAAPRACRASQCSARPAASARFCSISRATRGLTAYGFGGRDKHPAIAAKGAIPLERGDPVTALRLSHRTESTLCLTGSAVATPRSRSPCWLRAEPWCCSAHRASWTRAGGICSGSRTNGYSCPVLVAICDLWLQPWHHRLRDHALEARPPGLLPRRPRFGVCARRVGRSQTSHRHGF